MHFWKHYDSSCLLSISACLGEFLCNSCVDGSLNDLSVGWVQCSGKSSQACPPPQRARDSLEERTTFFGQEAPSLAAGKGEKHPGAADVACKWLPRSIVRIQYPDTALAEVTVFFHPPFENIKKD